MPLMTEHLSRCIRTLESSLKMLRESPEGSVEYEVYRNAAIKGFELALEISGKLLRRAIKPFFASVKEVDRLTFKDLFRHAAKHGLLDVNEVERWFTYRDNRNTTAHDYGEVFAEETLTLLSEFIEDAQKLQKRLDHVET